MRVKKKRGYFASGNHSDLRIIWCIRSGWIFAKEGRMVLNVIIIGEDPTEILFLFEGRVGSSYI